MPARTLTFATVAAVAAVALSACDSRYVRRDEFKTTVAQLRGEDTRMQAEATQLKQVLQARFDNYDTQISQLGGRLRVNVAAHFDYKQATIREEDRALLDEFAEVIRERNPGVVITAEGFADPVGSQGYNRRLGQARADAVRDYLVARGLSPSQIRTVSYGEEPKRQVLPGATGEKGLLNRRVALVIDYAPSAS